MKDLDQEATYGEEKKGALGAATWVEKNNKWFHEKFRTTDIILNHEPVIIVSIINIRVRRRRPIIRASRCVTRFQEAPSPILFLIVLRVFQ